MSFAIIDRLSSVSRIDVTSKLPEYLSINRRDVPWIDFCFAGNILGFKNFQNFVALVYQRFELSDCVGFIR